MNNPLIEKEKDGTRGKLSNICPFTVFGLFNKGITAENRKRIKKELANLIDVQVKANFSGNITTRMRRN